jgi:hypothetical protein
MTSTSLLPSCLRFARRLAPAVVAVSLVACGSSSPSGTKGTAMTDANNYMATQHELNIPMINAKAGTDLTLDWSGLTKDLLCHPIMPIKSVTFAEVPLRNKTLAQLEDELAVGTFNSTTEVTTYFILDNPTGTTTMLSALTHGNTHLDPTTDFVDMANTVYLVAFADSTQLNHGTESMAILTPTSDGTTTVTAPDACALMSLTFTAKLGTPLSVPNTAPYTIDWSKLTVDGFGNPIDFSSVTKIEIGYYDGKSVMDLETGFKDVELDATTLYAATDVNGAMNYDLANTKTMGGQAFAGFSPTNGPWAMALLNTNSSVPAPVAFTILQPK